MENIKVCVIGAGVIGVSSAFQIQQKFPQIQVDLIAEKFSPKNTSDVAAGYWRPPNVSQNLQGKYLQWALKTKENALKVLKNDTEAQSKGLSLCHGYHVSEKYVEKPYWKDSSLNFQMLDAKHLKLFPDFIKSGFSYTTISTEGSKFIPYYMNLFKQKGGKIIQKFVSSIDELYNDYDVIINCTGVGARTVANDEEVFPIRGYVLRVKAPWIKEYIYSLDPNSLGQTMYIYPNQDWIVLGGFKQHNSYSTKFIAEEREAILEYTSKFYPSIKNAEVISEHVGFRPGRSEVRLEMVKFKDSDRKVKAVIHNYGHGGSGLTLYWGCSLDVLNLFEEFIISETNSKL